MSVSGSYTLVKGTEDVSDDKPRLAKQILSPKLVFPYDFSASPAESRQKDLRP